MPINKTLTYFLLTLFIALAALRAPAAIHSSYQGKLTKTDEALFNTFITKTHLLIKYKKYMQLTIELKTAERILNNRSDKLKKKLAKEYIEAAKGYIFYFSRKIDGAMLNQAEICVNSAHKLDRSLYGIARRLKVAIDRKRSELYFNLGRMNKLKVIKKRLSRMGEKNNDIIFKQKVLKYNKQQQLKASRHLRMLLFKLEQNFVTGLKFYQAGSNKGKAVVYMPFYKAIQAILTQTPRPPSGGRYLNTLSVKYNCTREVIAVIRIYRSRSR